MPILKARPPKYCRYRESARVSIQGHTHYLPGKYNSPESLTEYRRLVAQWGGGIAIEPPGKEAHEFISVAEVLADYLDFAARDYGTDSKSHYHHMRRSALTVGEVYADLPARQFPTPTCT